MRIRKHNLLKIYFLEIFDGEILILNGIKFFKELDNLIHLLSVNGSREYYEDIDTCENSFIICEFRCASELAELYPEWFI